MLERVPEGSLVNVIGFGEPFYEAFPRSQRIDAKTRARALQFLCGLTPTLGSTTLWRPLHSIYLLSRSTASCRRSVFVFSDGHVTDEQALFDLAKANRDTTQLFTFGQ